MARKKHRGKRHPQQTGHHRKGRPVSQVELSDRVLGFLNNRRNRPAGLDDIMQGLDLARHQRKTIKEILLGLEQSGKVRQKKKKWQITGKAGLVRATLSLTAKGFGFAVLEGQVAREQKDIFIPPPAINGAGHGDTVLVRVVSGSRGRSEGRVVEIIKRGFSRLCGIYTFGGKTGYVTPDNDKMPFTVLIRHTNALKAKNGQAVLVEIIDYGTSRRAPEGRIIEVLGDPNSPGVQIRMAIEQFDLPRSFPAAAVVSSDSTSARSRRTSTEAPVRGDRAARRARSVKVPAAVRRCTDRMPAGELSRSCSASRCTS